jgi:hypothetical protein
MAIQQLMATPEPSRDHGWLKEALQDAIQLEFSTIPPYLCGMWSVKNDGDPVYDLIRGIVLEEMLHMGIACNLLVGVGGEPKIADPSFVPDYPCELPGGVRPGLFVGLIGLYRELVRDVYMQIEFPEHGPVHVLTAMRARRTYATIGEFYDAIAKLFQTLSPSIHLERQLVAPAVGLKKIPDLNAVAKAIDQIKEQGEGTEQSAFAEDFGGELAHYYRFMEIVVGQQIAKGADGKAHFDPTKPVPFPDVYPMAMVPKGGHPPALTHDFNANFTAMMQALQDAWHEGGTDGQSRLTDAFKAMFRLGDPAVALMKKEIDPGQGRGNYGPDFRLI